MKPPWPVASLWYQCLACKRLFNRPEKLILHKETTSCKLRFPYAKDEEKEEINVQETESTEETDQSTSSRIGSDISFDHHQYQNATTPTTPHDVISTPQSSSTSLPSIYPHHCRYCFKTLKSLKNLKIHLSLHIKKNHTHSCYFCSRRFRRNTSYKSHLSQHTNERPYRCKSCERSFKSSSCLYLHQCKDYRCEECDQYFNSRKRLQRHLASHENTAVCQVCNIGFPNEQNLLKHTRRICHLRRVWKLRGVRSKFSYTGQKKVPVASPSNYSSSRPRCNICCRNFIHTGYLHLHLSTPEHRRKALKLRIERVAAKIRRHSYQDSQRFFGTKSLSPPMSSTELHQCPTCNKVYPNASKLNRHLPLHTERFKCMICSKCFRNRFDLKRHWKLHSQTDIRKFAPNSNSVKEATITSKSLILPFKKRHQRRKPHPSLKMYRKSKCFQKFLEIRSDFNKMANITLANIRRVSARRLYLRGALAREMPNLQTHNESESFPVVSSVFSLGENEILESHRKIPQLHSVLVSDTGTKISTCPVCGLMFETIGKIRRHQSVHR